MKKRTLRGSKIYWVAQSRGSTIDRHVFRTRKAATHFVDHRIEGWAYGNDGTGWTVFQCSAIAEWRAT